MSAASVDPAFYNVANNPQFTGLAYDALVTFQQAPAPPGCGWCPTSRSLSRLRPTAARHTRSGSGRGSATPTASRCGPATSAAAIERLFRVGSPGTSYFSGLVGAARCARHPASCDLSRGIVTDDAAGTVVFHLTAPDPEFLFNLTSTLSRHRSRRAHPTTKPARTPSPAPGPTRSSRQPAPRSGSSATRSSASGPTPPSRTATPTRSCGGPCRPPQDAVAAIEHGRGRLDVRPDPAGTVPPAPAPSPALLHSSPEFGVDFAHLNTHRAPFNDVRVRQALNYAIDRSTIAQLYGGPGFATATCQPITPGLPGYRRYCPYTLHPRADGAYPAPTWLGRGDWSANRAPPANASTSGAGATTPTSPPGACLRRRGPAALGYRVHLHEVPAAAISNAMRRNFQISIDGDWLAAYPDPSSYIPQFFSCDGGNDGGYYCSPPLDRKMQQASQLELNNPAKAAATWTAIDRQLTNNAIWVPTVSEREVDLVSKRLHNYEYNPVWGFLTDQSWLG